MLRIYGIMGLIRIHGFMALQWRKYPDPDHNPLARGAYPDPDPPQKVIYPQHWFLQKNGNNWTLIGSMDPRIHIRSVTSFPDPDTDPPDQHVFRDPDANRIRILVSSCKTSYKNLDPFYLWNLTNVSCYFRHCRAMNPWIRINPIMP